jgi:nitrite reductase/ring-hydroxylating ferredoxin subunit
LKPACGLSTLSVRLEAALKIVPVAKLADLPPGNCRSVDADGFCVAVCNVGGAIYAVDNTCPHAGGPLGEGQLTGELIKCPWHGWRYDVRTGERPENPDIKVECFQTHVENDVIHVHLSDGTHT